MKDIRRQIFPLDEILPSPYRDLVCSFWWLQLLLGEGCNTSIEEIITMRHNQKYNSKDLELPYYPILLACMKNLP